MTILKYPRFTFLFPLLICSFASAPQRSEAADWSDASIGYRFGTQYREPVNPNKITKNTVSFSYASGYKYGGNFFNIDMLSSNDNDPASGGGGGAHEVYVVYRTTFSGNSITNSAFKFGIIRDLGITGGFDFSAKDDQFSARVLKFVVGPKISFDVPGFLDISFLYRTENNHNWYASTGGFGTAGCSGVCNSNVNFNNTYGVSTAWGLPFTLWAPFKFQGFLDLVGPKGRDGTGAATKLETLLDTALLVDAGSFFNQKNTFFVGPGYQYWHNKFGNDASLDSTGGSTASVPQLVAEIHF